ncbi:MAG: hypothetical protein U9N76_03460 [Candidatus Marinimicrobia bacterium]|nr:hypothetical protein [Candidatus Neomarinimicrobiota bacterium]
MAKKSKNKLNVTGRMSVEGFHNEFKNEFGIRCKIKVNGKNALPKATLASLRPEGFEGSKVIDLKIGMNSKVKNTKKIFKDEFGVDLELYYGNYVAPDDATLADLRDKTLDTKQLRKKR